MSSVPRSVSRIGVVVPAHNEEALLQGCLSSLARAAAHCHLPVVVVVVLDRCDDGTAEILRSQDASGFARLTWFVGRGIGVGATRDEGVRSLIDRYGSAGLWVANTDADSEVPADWLSRQLAHAASGADAIVGTIEVADWSQHPPGVRRRHLAAYRAVLGHHHVHGANLALSAAAYLQCGGFPPVASDEDVALIKALEATGQSLIWAADLAVVTSPRTAGRAPYGFAGHLSDLARAVEAEALSDVVC
ncbi:MAG: hypothetical protein QOE89_3346 [Pseudonocardiales bacterium]|nr:hypothetical protein [Pseudonocardiales bacterium]